MVTGRQAGFQVVEDDRDTNSFTPPRKLGVMLVNFWRLHVWRVRILLTLGFAATPFLVSVRAGNRRGRNRFLDSAGPSQDGSGAIHPGFANQSRLGFPRLQPS